LTQDAHPIFVGELSLDAPARVDPVGPQRYDRYEHARILVRLHGVPIGFIERSLPDRRLDPTAIEREAFRVFGGPILEHLERDGLPAPRDATDRLAGREACRDLRDGSWHEPISVVLCSRDRPRQLASCLVPLQALAYDEFEVVVVDNAPSSDDAARCFEDVVGDDPRFRYVREPRPGLSRARNRGLAEAAHAHVAFTDDDVLVDALWLDGLAKGFGRDPRAGAVTGLVPSAQLDTPFQRYFDERVWWSSATQPHVYDLATRTEESTLFPFDAGRIGTGANFAVDRRLIQDLGGFDEGLGAGSPTHGGEDMDAFVRVLQAGRTIVYEPAALVWHIHRTTYHELREHLYGYGVGLTAYITKYLLDPDSRGELLRRLPPSVLHMLQLWGRADAGRATRASLIFAEARGMVAGPLAYRRSRRSGRRSPS
jgi:GT2 family glycosyltransferase